MLIGGGKILIGNECLSGDYFVEILIGWVRKENGFLSDC